MSRKQFFRGGKYPYFEKKDSKKKSIEELKQGNMDDLEAVIRYVKEITYKTLPFEKEDYEKKAIEKLKQGYTHDLEIVIQLSKEYDKEIDFKDLPASDFEKVFINKLENGWLKPAKFILQLSKEYDKEINIPQEAFDEGTEKWMKDGTVPWAEEIIEFAKENGKEISQHVYENSIKKWLREGRRDQVRPLFKLAEKNHQKIDISKEFYIEEAANQIEDENRGDRAMDLIELAQEQGKDISPVDIPLRKKHYMKAALEMLEEGLPEYAGYLVEIGKKATGGKMELPIDYINTVANELRRGWISSAEHVMKLSEKEGKKIGFEDIPAYAFEQGAMQWLGKKEWSYNNAKEIIELAEKYKKDIIIPEELLSEAKFRLEERVSIYHNI